MYLYKVPNYIYITKQHTLSLSEDTCFKDIFLHSQWYKEVPQTK